MPEPTYALQLWYRWKSLRLPWRRKWLCGTKREGSKFLNRRFLTISSLGYDLSGHTFWEFVDPMSPLRPRRIVHYPRSTHYGDIALTPAWLQWLRKTRPDPPSIPEQQLDLQRQSSLKQLAAQADQRWREQESFLDKPQDTGQPQPLMQPRDKGAYNGGESKPRAPGSSDASLNAANTPEEVEQKTRGTQKGRYTEDPWKKHARGSGEEWQPDSWAPGKLESR